MSPLFAEEGLSISSVIGLFVSVVGVLAGAVAFLFSLYVRSQNAATAKQDAMRTEERARLEAAHAKEVELHKEQVRAEKEDKLVYKAMVLEANDAMETLANTKRRVEGKQPMPKMAAVVPVSNSPVTEEQQAISEVQTELARLAASKLELDLPAREAEEPETLDQRSERLQKEILERAVSPDVADKLLSKFVKLESDVAQVPEKTLEEFKKDPPTKETP